MQTHTHQAGPAAKLRLLRGGAANPYSSVWTCGKSYTGQSCKADLKSTYVWPAYELFARKASDNYDLYYY